MAKFFKCEICGKIVSVVQDSKASLVCCGQNMTELVPGISDGALEKHVPSVTVDKDTVNVQIGSALHPMTESHYIVFIALETTKWIQIRKLKSSDAPKAQFKFCPNDAGEKPVTVYEYCNIHGLWKKDLKNL